MRLVKGEVAALMTRSYRAHPSRLLDLGYRFDPRTVEEVIADAVRTRQSGRARVSDAARGR